MILQLLILAIIGDLIWLFFVPSAWATVSTNEYWNSLSYIHTFGIVLAWLQLLLKTLLVGYLFWDYKSKVASIRSILSFNYADSEEQLKENNKSTEENFENPY